MEMTGTDGGKIPKSYSLNMFKDFVPMCVLSEANQGEDHNSGFLQVLVVDGSCTCCPWWGGCLKPIAFPLLEY